MKAGVLTVSDRSFRGEREDLSGPTLRRWLSERGVETTRHEIILDDRPLLATKLREWADAGDLDLILTTGGTGVAPRDITPEATLEILDRIIPGLAEQMRAESLRKTPMASLSRAVVGVRKRSLILNLPGSPKGTIENLEAVWAAIPHAVAKIQGDPSECQSDPHGAKER